MKTFDDILSSFYIQNDLNEEIWEKTYNDSYVMRPPIRDILLEIANEFVDYLGYDIFVLDVVMTGSLANYNWSDFSDIDLHIMFDFKETGEQKDLFSDLFKLKKTLFNSTHDIKVKSFDVELYVQDTNEPHVSTGVYSVLYDKWIEQPNMEDVKINKEFLEQKVNSWIDKIDAIIENSKDEDLITANEMINKLKEKLKDYRNSGLKQEGEYSYENLVFKFLRRNGYIQKLFDFQNELMDDRLSLKEAK
jgi:predicted nucleotidyltransferase